MSSSGLETMNIQIMTKDNKQQKHLDSTDTAIAYSTCYVQPFSEVFNEDCITVMKRYPDKYFDLAVVDPPYGLDKKLSSGGGKMRNSPFKKLYRDSNQWENTGLNYLEYLKIKSYLVQITF